MEEIYGRIEIPDGLRPGQSRLMDGAYSTNLYDSDGNLEGNAPFIPGDKINEEDAEDENAPGIPPEFWVAVAAIVGFGVGLAVTKRKEVKAWAVSKWQLLTAKKDAAADLVAPTALANVEEPESVTPSEEIEMTRAVITMTSAEWQERFRMMVMAGALSEEQWRILANARVEDSDPAFRELQSELGSLTAQQFADRVRMLLASGDSPNSDGAIGELIRLFRRQREYEEVPRDIEDAADRGPLSDDQV